MLRKMATFRPTLLLAMPEAMRGFFAVYSLSLLASALPATLFYFYVHDFLGAGKSLFVFLGLYLIAGMVAFPFWKMLAVYKGAAQSWLYAMIFSVLAFVGVIFLTPGHLLAYGAICVASGLASGAELVLPLITLKKIIRDTGDQPYAVHRYALLAFIGKAMALVACLPLLPLWGAPNWLNTWLPVLYGAIPCLFKAMAACLLWRWLKTGGERNEKITDRDDVHAA